MLDFPESYAFPFMERNFHEFYCLDWFFSPILRDSTLSSSWSFFHNYTRTWEKYLCYRDGFQPMLTVHFGMVPPQYRSGTYRWKSSFRQPSTAFCWGKWLCMGFGDRAAARRECRWAEHVPRFTCSQVLALEHWVLSYQDGENEALLDQLVQVE